MGKVTEGLFNKNVSRRRVLKMAGFGIGVAATASACDQSPGTTCIDGNGDEGTVVAVQGSTTVCKKDSK